MLRSPLRADLSLVGQGVALGWDYGVHSLVGLARVAELLLHSVYEPGSLREEGGRVTFTLRNPPLRMGAFSGVRILWDGSLVDPSATQIAPDGVPPRTLSELGRESPVTIPVGRRTRFFLPAVKADGHRHRVRLELQSVAIPPRVWYEFSDELRPGSAP